MTIRIRFRRPAPAAKKACQHCEKRRALFRQQGITTWDPYYALCYRCYHRHVTHVPTGPQSPVAAEAAGNHPHRTLALRRDLMPAR